MYFKCSPSVTCKLAINCNSLTSLRCSAKSLQLCKCAPYCGLQPQPSSIQSREAPGAWCDSLFSCSYEFPTKCAAWIWVDGACRYIGYGSSYVSQFRFIWWWKGRTTWTVIFFWRDFMQFLRCVPSLWPWPSFLSWLSLKWVWKLPQLIG